MSSGHRIALKGYVVKNGQLVENEKRFDLSTQIKRRRGSKKVRVVRRGKR